MKTLHDLDIYLDVTMLLLFLRLLRWLMPEVEG